MLTATAIRNPQFAQRFAVAMRDAIQRANWQALGVGCATVLNRRGRVAVWVCAHRRYAFGPVQFEFFDSRDNDITATVLRGLAQYAGPLFGECEG